MGDRGRVGGRRASLPAVEPLEGRRLASGPAAALPGPAIEREPLASGPARDGAGGDRPGLAQLARYLGRSWYRAGITPQGHDDCSQEVYLALIEGLGPDRFRGLIEDIEGRGIRDVLGRETDEGPDFFRAVDRVKMRARRERGCLPLEDAGAVAAPSGEALAIRTRAELAEAGARVLGPREAALIDATLAGETPAEIAARWGVAAKTVSNEKTRALQKLRDSLLADDLDP